jgi:hypothetical protein
MTEQALSITYSNDSQRTLAMETFIHLEQIKEQEYKETVTMYDIQQMVARARSGMSAWSYKPYDCPAWIEGPSVVTEFDFYAWVSRPDLQYSLSTNFGNVSGPTVVLKSVEFSVTFELTDVVEFDFILEEISSWHWETQCYDNQGNVVDNVTIEMDGLTTLRASAPIFGVVRLYAVKRGMKHTLTARLVKTVHTDDNRPTEEEFEESGAGDFYSYDEWLRIYFPDLDMPEDQRQDVINLTGISITNLQVVVTAHWVDHDEEQTEQLQMSVPTCLEDLLKACWVDTDGDGIPDSPPVGDPIFNLCPLYKDESPWNVYVSQCSGRELAAYRQDGDDSGWCGRKK